MTLARELVRAMRGCADAPLPTEVATAAVRKRVAVPALPRNKGPSGACRRPVLVPIVSIWELKAGEHTPPELVPPATEQHPLGKLHL